MSEEPDNNDVSEKNKIRTVTRWVTSDHKEHYSLDSAEWHAENMDSAAKANRVLDSGGSVGDALRASGFELGRPFPEMLERITKETKLVISYWQCRETPGYKVQCFRPDMKLYVWGHAGCWSGPYGGNVSIEDIARYAKEPATEGLLPAPTPVAAKEGPTNE